MQRAFQGKARWLLLGGLAAVLVAGSYGVQRLRAAPPGPPTAPVVQGEMEVLVKARGEVKAVRSVTLAAPATVTDVKIVNLAKGGSSVKAGDVVVEIDATQERTRLQEQQSALKQADAEIEKTRAQGRIENEQDRLDLAQGQFEVEKARLEVSKQEIVSEIEAGKAKLVLESAERRLAEVGQRIAAHKHSQAADLDQVAQKRKKSQTDVKQAQGNLERLTIRSPLAGILNIMPNWSASTTWQSAPEFKPGDRAWPGASIAEIPDLSSLVVELNIEETDRGRIAAEQPVRAKVDALSDRVVPGKIRSISAVAEVSYASWPPQKTFRALVGMDTIDSRLRPGMSAGAEIVVDRLRGVTLIPRRAAFERGGKAIAYVRTGRDFEAREIILGHRSETQIEVRQGLRPGETVALEEPPAAGSRAK